MYRREFLILAAIGLMVVAIVAGCTGLLVYRLNVAVKEVAEVTVPDLLSIGQLNQRLLDNWSKVLLIQRTALPEERLKLIAEINSNSTEPQLEEFQKTPTLPEQQAYLVALLKVRGQFIQQREEYFKTVNGGNMNAAAGILEQQLMPVFQAYRQTAESLYSSTSKIGRSRADRVVHTSKVVIFGAGILSVLTFFAGFLVGFCTLFRGLKWAHALANRTVTDSKS